MPALERAGSTRSEDETYTEIMDGDEKSSTHQTRHRALGFTKKNSNKNSSKSKSELSHYVDVITQERKQQEKIVHHSSVVKQTVKSKNATELFGSKITTDILGSGYTVNHFYYQFKTKEIMNGQSEKWINMLRNERTFLMKSLNVNRSVKTLDLSGNGKNFGDEGARLLCQVLMKNKSIENMNISGNCITNAGAIFLGRLIDKNFSIRCLDLSNNAIEDDGAQQLSDGLIHNKCLNQLIIFGNRFSSKGFMELTRVIAYNSNLRELILWEPF